MKKALLLFLGIVLMAGSLYADNRKQIKREEKLEAAKNRPANGGFSLGDDPRFKELFGKKE